jgi:hypothetical protein
MHVWLLLLALFPAFVDPSSCQCDPARPETMAASQCGLCRAAELQPGTVGVFFLKDSNSRKPNRWLALPRKHIQGTHPLEKMTAADRLGLWQAAIDKAKSLWGEHWALAMNGDLSRTQCHMHVHIGKLIDGLETGDVLVVDDASQIPVPADGSGLWVHAFGNKLHVHIHENLTEPVLLR